MIGIVVEENGEKFIKVLSSAGYGLPLGTIIANYSEAAPDGFLECDGSVFDTKKYSMLYSLLGKDTLPDLRGKALMGYDANNPLFSDQEDTVPNIKGTANVNGYSDGTDGAFSFSGSNGNSLLMHDSSAKMLDFDASASNEKYVDDGEVRPKNIRIMWCIKATAAYVEPDTASELQTTIQANDRSYIDSQLNNIFEYVEAHIPTKSVPIGTLISLNNNENAPSGYLKADGSTFDETAYPALYRYLGNSNVLPTKIEFDGEGDRELYVEKIIGEINGKLVYQLTIEDNVNRAANTWYDMTSLFAGYLDPADVDYFLDGAAVSNIHHEGDGYQHDAFYSTIVGTNKAKTVINIWFQHKNHSEKLNYPSEDQEPKYITVRYTRVANPLATPKYKYIRALSGINESENTVLVDYLNSLEARLTQSGAEPIGTLRSIVNGNNGVAPVGYLKCDGSLFDETQYPVLYAYLNSNRLPVIRDYTNTEVSEPNVEKIVGEWNGKPVYEVTVAHGSNIAQNTWYDVTADFAAIIDPSELERFVGNAYLFNGYYDADQWWETDPQIIIAKNSAETQIRIYSIYMSTNPMTNAQSGQGPLYLKVRYTRKDDSTAKATSYYKFMKAVSGMDETESAEVVSAITALMNKVAYSTLPVGNLISVQNDSFIPAGYLKCDGSTFDENDYPLLYHYLGDSNVLPNLYEKEVGVQPDYRGVYRSDNYTGDFPRFASVRAVLEDAGINVEGNGFRDDGILVISLKRYWEMLWIQDPDGTVWCQGQVPYTNSYDGDTATIPVKKGQKIYAITQTGGSTNAQPPAGTYDSPECYVSIYYYKTHKYIKAVSGVEDNSSEASEIVNQVTDMYNSLFNKVAACGMPLGTVLTLPNETINPAGYLKCDGSAFDTAKYPLLYDYLGSDHLPNLYSHKLSDTPDIAITSNDMYASTSYDKTILARTGYIIDDNNPWLLKFEYDGLVNFQTDDWCVIYIGDEEGNLVATYTPGYRGNAACSISFPVKKGQRILTINESTGVDLATFAIYDFTTILVWYYKEHQYIKAVTGLEDNDEEATAIASQVEALTNKVAYCGQPVGHTMFMANNNVTPTGYLKCDGRDTTGTSDELETHYPLLYAYLGNTNVLPSITDGVVHKQAPDIALMSNAHSATYPYSWHKDLLVYSTATPAERKNWCIKFEHDGFVDIESDDWFTVYIGDEEGNLVATYLGGVHDNASNSTNFPVKKGQQILTINRESSINLNTFYFGDYSHIFVWYYDNYAYIKGVSGIEDGSTEATEVANAIAQATDSIERNAEDYIDSLHIPGSFSNWWNYELNVDYPIGEFDGKIVYRRIWKDPNNFTASDSWRLVATDPNIGYIFDLRSLTNNYKNFNNNGTDNNDTYMYGLGALRYRFTRSNGELYTASSNDTCNDVYYMMDFTKATKTDAIRLGNATANRYNNVTDFIYDNDLVMSQYIRPLHTDYSYWVPATTYTATAIINPNTGAAFGTGWVFVGDFNNTGKLCIQNTTSFDYYFIDSADWSKAIGSVNTASALLGTSYAYVIKGKFMEA